MIGDDTYSEPAPKRVQDRALETQRKIANGTIALLASDGVVGLTHRAVAKAAGVSLAATTYHFNKMPDILALASQTLMENYLESFSRFQNRLIAGEKTGLQSPHDLVLRLVRTAIVRERVLSLAWCELMVHAGRNEDGRLLARNWFSRLETIWLDILRQLDPAYDAVGAKLIIDRVIGLTLMLHPLLPDAQMIADIVSGDKNIIDLPNEYFKAIRMFAKIDDTTRHGIVQEKLVKATIDILVAEGAGAVSYGTVAKRVGMVRSGPNYYFSTISSLVETAQITLFERAKARYRSGLHLAENHGIDNIDQLAMLTTRIFMNEITHFARDNIGYFSGWLNAVRNPALRPFVLSVLADQQSAWQRRLTRINNEMKGEMLARSALLMQADFIGKLMRYLATGNSNHDEVVLANEFSISIKNTIRCDFS